jgi:hypothetical protein
MSDDTCRYPGCDNETRDRGEEEYPDSDKTASNGEPFRVSSFGSKFCSVGCELKYEKRKADAQEAKRQEERQSGVDPKDLPERDGPPY